MFVSRTDGSGSLAIAIAGLTFEDEPCLWYLLITPLSFHDVFSRFAYFWDL